MHPVLIFQHAPIEGPGYFASFLDRHDIPWRLVRIDAGEPVPSALNGISGVCLMGGPMSVNDDLPWIPPLLALIRQAVAADIPVIGHCLGGQLMAKALGASVAANPVKEIGWGEVRVTDPAAGPWLGDDAGPMQVFHWHGETFALPAGATRILESAWCANQAYVLNGIHVGMQCHVEMTPELVAAWCEHGADEIAAARESPAVQTPETIAAETVERIAPLHRLADKIYSRWIQGLSR